MTVDLGVFKVFKSLWDTMPRKVKFFLLGIALASIDKKFPGYLPSIDPEWYVGGGLGLAVLHTVTDSSYAVRNAPRPRDLPPAE